MVAIDINTLINYDTATPPNLVELHGNGLVRAGASIFTTCTFTSRFSYTAYGYLKNAIFEAFVDFTGYATIQTLPVSYHRNETGMIICSALAKRQVLCKIRI